MESVVTQSGAVDRGFWNGRRVLLTGHTGFKGAWAALWLARMGAHVHGFALPPGTAPNLWHELGPDPIAGETLADLADLSALREAVDVARPQIVLHLAAQAIVRRGHDDPLGTVRTNTMGTANLLEALRGCDSLEALVVVTTDKVYANGETGRAFSESDRLGGGDPYGASKAAAELVTAAYAQTFFAPRGIAVGTARAGNVIGGGDWAPDRLVPDIWRAARSGEAMILRAPGATRPWQHVLEPLAGYFTYAQALAGQRDVPSALNFGPDPGTGMTVAEIAAALSEALGMTARPVVQPGTWPEAGQLKLDSALARRTLGWHPRLDDAQALDWTAAWYAAHRAGTPTRQLCLDQIELYEALA